MITLRSRLSLSLVVMMICSIIMPILVGPQVARAETETSAPQILLDPSMITLIEGGEHQNHGPGNDPKLPRLIEHLVDEQEATYDDKGKDTSRPSTYWHPAEASETPGVAILDLKTPHSIHEMRIFERNGSFEDGFILEYQKDGEWIELHNFDLRGFNDWRAHKLETPVNTRYIRVTHMRGGKIVAELRLHGYALPIDETPPAKIDSLTATAVGSTVELHWTAPGNDGELGTAAQYDIRYSLSEITEDNWDAASSISDLPTNTNPPAPAESGTNQSVVIPGLLDETKYYFAMKAMDDWIGDGGPNVSELSNVAVVVTLPDTTPPDAIVDLTAAVIGSKSMTLTWTATGDNESVGTAEAYDLRYSTLPETVYASVYEWWQAEETVVVTGLPAPKPSGNSESFEVTGLQPETDYYFAIMASDKKDNKSPISDILHVITDELDVIAPGKITDLSVVVANPNVAQANLSWTAPGNDDYEGTATQYDVRYSTEPIDETNWADAHALLDAPAPLAADSAQMMVIEDLPKGQYYYVAIKTRDQDNNESELSNVVSFGFAERIMLDPSMIINETGLGNPDAMVNQQHLTGDPAAGAGNRLTVCNEDGAVCWSGFRNWLTDNAAIIDLGRMYELTELYFYDGTHSGDVHVFTGDPTQWVHQFTEPLTSYLSWNKHEFHTGGQPNTQSRYIRIELTTTTHPVEVVVYGIPLEPMPELPEPAERTYALMRDFIGINAFIDDPLDKLAVAGTIREYHPWRWDEVNLADYPNNVKAFQPSVAGGGSWYFDTYYRNLKEMGIEVFPAIMEFNTIFGSSNEHKPVLPGQDPADPFSYASHADHMFQYAARYGSQPVEDHLLKLRADQERLSGLNLIKYYEDVNEQNMNWGNRATYFTPLEYAAMASADYDGHMGQMGATFGVKNADPQAMHVMGGLAGLDLDYIKAMKLWSDHFRLDEEGKATFPADVINVHHYSNTAGSQIGGDVGVSPESDGIGLKAKAEELVDWKNQHLPEQELWISEIGYDTHPNSTQRAPNIGTFTHEDVQAQWLVRTFMALAAAGVDRVQMYMFRDVNPNDATKYSTSGLVSSQATGYVPKPSWYYLYTIKNHLGDMRFAEEIKDPAYPGVINYRFESDAGESAYVLWSPTDEQIEINNYPFQVSGDWDTMTQITLSDQLVNGSFAYLPVVGQEIILNISENPIIIREGHIADTIAPSWQAGDAVSISNQTLTTVDLHWPVPQGEEQINYYSIYNGSKLVKTISALQTSYTVTGLSEGAEYDFRIIAGDVKGKQTSVPLTTSLRQPDISAPSQPQNVIVQISTASQVMLSWDASTDNLGVTAYHIYNGEDQLVGTAPGHAILFTVQGLRPSTEYTLVVRAVDAAGNESEPSEAVTVKTLSNPASSYTPAPSGPSGTGVIPTDQPQGISGIQSQFDIVANADGQFIATTVVTEQQWLQAIALIKRDQDEPVTIRIDAPSQADGAEFHLSGKLWASMQEQLPDEAKVSFRVGNVSYELPMNVLDLEKIAQELETDADQLTIQMVAHQVDWEQYLTMMETANQHNSQLITDGFSFELRIGTPDGEHIQIDDFGHTYVERIFHLQRYVPHSDVTAVRYDSTTGTLHFVPALFKITPTGTEVTVKSSSNSIYAIVKSSKTFMDISNSYAQNDIKLLASKLIIHGKSSTHFDPGGLITRSEFAAMIIRALGMKISTSSTPYNDVTSHAWYADVVSTISQAKLMLGDGGRFRPEDPISREEAAVILHRVLQMLAPASDTHASEKIRIEPFHDADQISAWAREAMQALLALEIMTGFTDQTLRPKQTLTREQTAIITRKLLQELGFIN